MSELKPGQRAERITPSLRKGAHFEPGPEAAGSFTRTGTARPKGKNHETVVESARRRGQIAIGYRLRAQAGEADAARGYGVVVNPDKSRTVTFGEGDKIIVIAEE